MKLANIVISNVRKFSDNVEIPISQGATVFLAPNGTGKTAIFEAIELALTGQVRRLPPPPNALIRDTKSKSFVKLTFDNGSYCEVDFAKGKTPILSGNHQELFGSIPSNDVPFLLRLTHLLSQQNNEWFVQKEGTEAGGQLDHLSIGRDAAYAGNLMTGAKKSSKARMDEATKKLTEAAEKKATWTELLNKRTISEANDQKNLRPLKEIAYKLDEFGKLLAIGTLTSSDVSDLIARLSIIEDLFEQRQVTDKSRRSALDALQNVIRDFIENENLLPKAEQDLAATRTSKKNVADQIAKLNERFLTLSKEIKVQEDSLVLANNLKGYIEQRDKIINELASLKTSMESLGKEQQELESSIVDSNIAMKEAERITAIEQKVLVDSQSLAKLKSEFETAATLIGQWREVTLEIARLNSNRSVVVKEIADSEKSLAESEERFRQVQAKITNAQNRFDTLNSTSDVIKEAIGHIASHLTEDVNECPVCLASYPKGELQTRIAKALNDINPLLKEAADELDRERLKLGTEKEEFDNANAIVEAGKARLRESDRLIGSSSQRIVDSFQFKIRGSQTLEQSIVSQKETEERISKLQRDLAAENEKLKVDLQRVSVSSIIAQHKSLNEKLIAVKEKVEESSRNISSLEKRLQPLLDRIGESKTDFKAVDADITKIENTLTNLKTELGQLRTSQDEAQRVLGQTNNILVNEEENYNRLMTRQRQLRVTWIDQGLPKDPNSQALQIQLTNIEKKINENERGIDEVSLLSLDLAKWKAFEDFSNTEKAIETFRGALSEDDLQLQLDSAVLNAEKKLEFIKQRAAVLASFSDNVSTQLENVHEQIKALNPLWNKLLNRIVLDSRFSEITLESFTHYKKQHASVNVPLNGEDVLASYIASEAQITDLQFTFLMAMAQKYKWSPWRALLLDDPTQHHDLVHASSVFDLLRDYIIDQEFQVLLATHDSVQANFFVRKLENDGIPTKLYRLRATADGAKAELY